MKQWRVRLGRTPVAWAAREHSPFTPRDRHLLLFACGFYFFAQSFIAWGWPALDGYPAIERWLDPNFLRADFYTSTTDGYGVDTWQAILFGSIQRVTGLHYDLQIAILTALRHLVWPWALYRFFKALVHDETTALVAVLLGVLGNFALPKTLGWSWVWGDGSPALFATFFVVLAWAELIERRAWSCFLLLAVATVCQPLIGVHGGVFIAAIYLLDYSAAEKGRALRTPANYLAGIAFVGVFASQFISLSPSAAERLPIQDYVRILAWERHPGDFLPGRFPLTTWISFGLAAAAIGIVLVRNGSRLPRRALILGGLTVYAAICLAGYFLVELWPVRLIVDLIPFRTVTIGAPLMLAIIAVFATNELRARRWIAALALIAAFVLAGPYSSVVGISPIVPAAILLLVAILASAAATPITETDDAGAVFVLRLAVPVLLVMAIPLMIVRHPAMILPTVANQHPVYSWARGATPPNARFLVEQVSSDQRYSASISPQLMRLVGRRAVIASRDFPFRDSNARAWLQTWVVGLDHGRKDRVETASAAQLLAICGSLPFDYVLRQRPLPAGRFPEVARFGAANGVATLHVYRICR